MRAATAPAAGAPKRRFGAPRRRRTGALQDAGARFGRPRSRSVLECGGPPPLYLHEHLLSCRLWLNPAVHEIAVSTHLSAEEKRRWRVIFGLGPVPEMTQEEADLEQMNKYRKVFGMEPKTLEDAEDKEDKESK